MLKNQQWARDRIVFRHSEEQQKIFTSLADSLGIEKAWERMFELEAYEGM
jgi:hypothetical protein